MRLAVVLLVGVVTTGLTLLGQPPEAAAPRFEVVSIKSWVAGRGRNGFGGGRRIQADPSSLRMRTASVEEIVMYAYGLTWYGQLVGVPEGLGAYDIDAKTTVPSTGAEERMMLRAALADRFRFVCHWEKRDGRGYALAVSGRIGLQPDSGEGDAESRLAAGGDGGVAWSFKRISMAAFSEWLAGRVDGPVVDNTGLTGRYDFDLSGGGSFGVSDYVVVLRQLGLRLTQSRTRLDILVADQVERPSEN